VGDVSLFVDAVKRVADGGTALDPVVIGACSNAAGRWTA
jgi:hypothetical protein